MAIGRQIGSSYLSKLRKMLRHDSIYLKKFKKTLILAPIGRPNGSPHLSKLRQMLRHDSVYL